MLPKSNSTATDEPSTPAGQGSQLKRVLLEALLLGLIGGCLALTVNQLSPRGLKLTRDYFPKLTNVVVNVGTNSPGSGTNTLSAAEILAAQLRANGLQLADSNMVSLLHQDLRYAEELVVFIDAREDKYYQEGHIPGAYQFDRSLKDKYLPAVLPVCSKAQQIVVYCNGGNCDESIFAAIDLRSEGVTPDKLFIYGGGMTEWMTNGLPFEVGARKSGNLRTNLPAPVTTAGTQK